MPRAIPLPVRLALLVAGTTLPLILFAGVIVYQHYLQDQRDAFERVTQVTRGIQLVFDREMQGIVSGLTVLAGSHSLAQGDFAGFRSNVDAFLSRFPNNPSIVIADKTGLQIFNSAVPSGAAPLRSARPNREEVFRNGKPSFSPVFIGALSQRPLVTVTVPVMRDGEVVYDLSFNPPQQVFQRIIEQQTPSSDWTISIFDQTGVNFARVPNPARTLGQRAAPSLFDVMFSAPEGRARTISLEGVPLLTAFSRSELTGWIAAGGIAESTLIAPALKTFMLTAAIGIVMLAIGLYFAIAMATRIARAEALHDLLIDELNHRVKNTLATVQSLCAQSFRQSNDAEAREKFSARLASLGATHDVLSHTKWEGTDLKQAVDNALRAFEGANPERIQVSGPEVRLSSRTVVMVSMVIHELATNAAKYGALSVPNGRVLLAWREVADPSGNRIFLEWREIGGPPVHQPTRSGFGSTLIEKGLAAQLGGRSELRFEPGGVTCTLEFPAR